MKKRPDNSGVVEDIWINTHAGVDDGKPDWDKLEQENLQLNPDDASMESRG